MDLGSSVVTNDHGTVHCLTVIGQIAGHGQAPSGPKTPKYEHVLPLLASIEESQESDGLLVLLHTMGVDVEALLASAEMIAGMTKPTVTLVLGGGHTIGIPTVNLVPPPHVRVPGDGVYVARVCLEDGSSYAAVTNVGTRPPVNNGSALTEESWMLDFEGDLYGQSIRVEFYRRLRDEIRFDSLEALKLQIETDAESVRAYFKEKQ